MKILIKNRLIFFIGLILFLDGLLLIIFRSTLHLGTMLPLMIGLMVMIWTTFYNNIHNFLNHHYQLKRYYTIGWALFWLWVVSLGVFFGFIAKYSTIISGWVLDEY